MWLGGPAKLCWRVCALMRSATTAIWAGRNVGESGMEVQFTLEQQAQLVLIAKRAGAADRSEFIEKAEMDDRLEVMFQG